MADPVPPPESDHNKERLLACATACLNHIRLVHFGEATASYTVTDGALSLDVLVRVTCLRKAERADA